ncbi:phosphate ABC transporter permease subunit PstC [Pacificimonas flava]|uniref:Phosphate transport system permease protein n=2 Tax=Pacificimonas TaxID=1960290 RepID=A0A219B713_9SPHN|nr:MULTISPECIES: phosphate ABC transporter permease subunit PstC [Pacificimonas]MBZ6378774.1 phosphate ABC transporter permease subunit PstC [Pacificimonas aurantium]OWV33964.1 phosphate ABC transporter permease subunit PstC [Pacificimonas flava]
MTLGGFALIIVALAVLAYLTTRARAAAFGGPAGTMRSHSRPVYHGAWAAILAFVPAILVIVFWAVLGDNIVAQQTLARIPEAIRPGSGIEQQAFLNELRAVYSGALPAAFNENVAAAVPVYGELVGFWRLVIGGLALLLALIGGGYAWLNSQSEFRARTHVESFATIVLALASLVAILTTFGIVLSLLYESLEFFSRVSPFEFIFGTQWSPQTAIREDQVGSTGAFGAVPLFWGTVFIGAIIAMIVAIPLGLMSAIYLTQYAGASARRILKPLLEILAGVPTVVYGYFAALTVAPAVREFAISIGIDSASSESALAAGAVMGIMIIPFVSSMADDALSAVPGSMRDGSLAMGATPSETIKKVLVPAALPGIVGGILLAVSRAIGETMIVVMAAGQAANLTANPFESVTTVTAQIVQLLTGDQEFDSAKTLSAFALGLVLFIVTLLLNIYALAVVKRYREAYD